MYTRWPELGQQFPCLGPGLLRNVAVAMGNSRLSRFRLALEKLAQHPDPIIQEHARWALQQLSE